MTIFKEAVTDLMKASQEELAENCGLTRTLIVIFLQNGEHLTFPGYLNMGMARYVEDFSGFLFSPLERRSIADTMLVPLPNQIFHSNNRYKAG